MPKVKDQTAQDRKQEEKQKNFRISAKRIILTYSQAHSEMSTEDVLEQLKNKPSLGQFNYLIAREVDEDGGLHFHVVLINFTKFSIQHSAFSIQHSAFSIQHKE